MVIRGGRWNRQIQTGFCKHKGKSTIWFVYMWLNISTSVISVCTSEMNKRHLRWNFANKVSQKMILLLCLHDYITFLDHYIFCNDNVVPSGTLRVCALVGLFLRVSARFISWLLLQMSVQLLCLFWGLLGHRWTDHTSTTLIDSWKHLDCHTTFSHSSLVRK